MKIIIKILVLTIVIYGCNRNDLNESESKINFDNKYPEWSRSKFDFNQQSLDTDTIFIDTTVLKAFIPPNFEVMEILLEEDNPGNAENLLLRRSYNMDGGFIDIKNIHNKQLDTTYYLNSETWFITYFDPLTKSVTRTVMLEQDTIGINSYELDSIYFELRANGPEVTTTTSTDTIKKIYNWSIEKRCGAIKSGVWKHWDKKGELKEVVDWSKQG